jgi:hypothetical protein
MLHELEIQRMDNACNIKQHKWETAEERKKLGGSMLNRN